VIENVNKVSASLINTFDMCQQKWLLQYILNIKEPAGKAAELGTCGHSVLEAVAKSKIVRQEGKRYKKDKLFGNVYARYDLDKWIDIAFEECKKRNPHLKFAPADKRKLSKNVHTAVAHEFSPENHKEVIAVEKFFTLPIDKPWGKATVLEDGEVKEKQLYVNGFIDIIFRNDAGELNYLDYKFGRPYDWNKGVDKTYSNIVDDIQLCLYYYAMQKLYPDEPITTIIWYIAYDKVFILNFGDETIRFAEERLQAIFEKIRYLDKPACNYGSHCNFCPYRRYNFSNWDLDYLNMPHHPVNHFRAVNGMSCVCDALKTFLTHRGLTVTIENLKQKRTKK